MKSSKSNIILDLLLLLVLALTTVAVTTATITTPTTYIIAGEYETKSKLAKRASFIDLDQKELLKYLVTDDESLDETFQLEKAKAIYEKGMHSGPSYAQLSLKEPISREDAKKLMSTLHEHDEGVSMTVIGMSNSVVDRKAVYGSVEIPQATTNHDGGITHLFFHYNDASNSLLCRVGGNPEPQLDGCLVSPKGGLLVQGYGGAVDYTYDPIHDNKLTSTLMGYSEEEGEAMLADPTGYVEYAHYYQYYGQLEYGHHWIDSAFHQRKTDYTTHDKLLHGNEDFSLYKNEDNANTKNGSGLGIAIATATITLNVFTQINRLMVENAVGACKKHTYDFSSYGGSSQQVVKKYVEAWDIAVATYAGSMLMTETTAEVDATTETNDNDKDEDTDTIYHPYGTSYFGMVEELANDFGVVTNDNNNKASFGRSSVNSKIMKEFRVGREALLQGDCESASDSYYRIIHFMRIPLIQGVLRSAYELSQTTTNENNLYERGRGSAYLAALLPDLNHCSTESANIIYDQLKVTTPPTNGDSPSGVVVVAAVDYKVIHDEIYKHLECLRIDCNDLGGYINTNTGIYFPHTVPLCDKGTMFDATSTETTERRYTKTYPTSESTTTTTTNSSSSSSTTDGHLHYFLFGLVVVCGCVIAMVGTSASRSSSSSSIYSRHSYGRSGDVRVGNSGIVSSFSSQADYWFSQSSFGGSSSGISSNSSLGESSVELRNSSFSSSMHNSHSSNNDKGRTNNDSFSSSIMSLEVPCQDNMTTYTMPSNFVTSTGNNVLSSSSISTSTSTMRNHSHINYTHDDDTLGHSKDNIISTTQVNDSLL